MQEMPLITWSLYSQLVAFVNARIKDRSAAEDIVQEVFIKVYTKSEQLKEKEKFIGWIYQVTRHAVADHFRNRVRNLQPVNVDWDSSYNEFNDCVARCLTALMSKLPDIYRIPLHLAEIDNMSQFEIAERLKITYSGARSRVQRARKMLKEKLETLYYIKTDPYGNVVVCENRGACCCDDKY